MSQKIQLFLIVCIAIALGAMLLRQQQPQAPVLQDIQITQPEQRSITVVSDGEVKARPDTVEFTIVIETTNKELAVAKIQNETTMIEIMNTLESHAIEKKDIVSDYLRIKTESTSGRIYKYIVDRLIKVTIHELSEMEPLFTDLQQAGANQITQINFSISQIDLYREQALNFAIQAAEKKAQSMAKLTGLEIGKPLTIQENPNTDNRNYLASEIFVVDNLNSNYVYNNMNYVAFTEISIKTRVTITFELK